MNGLLKRLLGAMTIVAAAVGMAAAPAHAQGDQQVLVNQAETTLSNFMRDPEMKWLQQNFKRAKAVMIAPELLKAGFIFGGSGGGLLGRILVATLGAVILIVVLRLIKRA